MAESKVRMWESLRADARAHDAEIESKLSKLSLLAQEVANNPASAPQFEALADELDRLSRKLHAVVMSMSDIVDGLPRNSETQSLARHTQRFEDLVGEKNQALRRLRTETQKRRERAELLSKVHTEINVFNESSELRSLSSENESLRHTQRKTREILEQAELSRQRLQTQRAMFMGISEKVVSIVEKVPMIGGILRKIDQKRRRDVLILAAIIAICVLLTLAFW